MLNYLKSYEEMNKEVREIASKIRKGIVALEDADDVNYLRREGVSERVVETMQAR